MKKIKDERLVIQSLKNIRITFLVQTVGILAILVYEFITNDVQAVFNHPLWIVLIVTSLVLISLNLKISVDIYDNAYGSTKPGPFYRIIILSIVVGVVLAFLAKLGPDKSNNMEALIVGGVVFVCVLIPFSFVHYLRKKRAEENDI